MKILNTISLCVLVLVISQANAQPQVPGGFKKGTLVLADKSILSGLVRDNIRKNASVVFYLAAEEKKRNYDGSDLLRAEIDGTNYLC
ncbi:MAG: hypothetical protein H7Y42_12730, partial [Chitinophagaceae bacterium]|nr:hypothetical protein [Chitinophagaceae bacterium]